MKTKQIAIFLCLITIGSLTSCKKKSTDPEPEPETPPTPVVNQLCDGKGSTGFYPLDSTDNWGYGFKIMGVAQSVHPSLKVTGHQTYSSIKYAVIHDAANYFPDTYLREDLTTHNIYRYDDNNMVEYLEIPGSPVLNQSWSSTSTYMRKVTNLSASKTTSGCSYTGLLEVSEYDSSSTLLRKLYYKKGLGLVYSIESGSFPGEFTLSSVTLM